MTKKDYVKIAAVFAKNRPLWGDARGTWNDLKDDMSAILAADNPAFDHSRFEKACLK